MSEEPDIEGEVDEEPRDPEAEARRRLALAQIRQYPDPVLRMRANEIEDFDEDLRRLVERMTQLMHDARGVGLAATQLGLLRRVFVFQPTAEDEPVAVVNPTLTVRSDESESDNEGCLSMQGVSIPIERILSVTIDGRDVSGTAVHLELEGMPARVVQHELDHLDGVLIIDRTTPESRREALGILRPTPLLGVA